jgi:hypothetical protein
MITAEQAHKLKNECKTYNIVARQLEYVYSRIEGAAKLGKSKCNWIGPDEFDRDEIEYIKEHLRHRGFELERSGGRIYTILW